MDVREVELWRVREPAGPLRVSIDSKGVEELAQSIKEHGLLNPITVRARGDFFEVVAGHRRLLALRRLDVPRASIVVVGDGGADAVVLGAHENLVRRDLSLAEEAKLVVALMAREGWGIGATARALNRSEGWVRDRTEFLGWPEGVQVALHDGRLSMGAAKALMGVEDERERDALIEHAIRSGVSVEVAKRWREDANLGRGISGQGVSLVGVVGAVVSAPGPRVACFLCGTVATYAELIYLWVHRECAVALQEGLEQSGSDGTGAPPGGGVGNPAPAVPGA